MQRLMGRPWFRRRSVGFGWRPVSWQGWAVSAAALALAVGVIALMRGSPERIPLVILILAAYAVVALLTGARRAEAASEALVEEAPAHVETRMAPASTARRPRPATSQPPALVVERLRVLPVDAVTHASQPREVAQMLGGGRSGGHPRDRATSQGPAVERCNV